ncbi:MAG: hypothetical protein K0Q92_630 [Steroidobacteraceae bacterium]|jgi:hypothetical protein|nr:hypothetical protein [Steroidobacteraceae bacterium]
MRYHLPQPEVTYLDHAFGWFMWDQAVAELDSIIATRG